MLRKYLVIFYSPGEKKTDNIRENIGSEKMSSNKWMFKYNIVYL